MIGPMVTVCFPEAMDRGVLGLAAADSGWSVYAVGPGVLVPDAGGRTALDRPWRCATVMPAVTPDQGTMALSLRKSPRMSRRGTIKVVA